MDIRETVARYIYDTYLLSGTMPDTRETAQVGADAILALSPLKKLLALYAMLGDDPVALDSLLTKVEAAEGNLEQIAVLENSNKQMREPTEREPIVYGGWHICPKCRAHVKNGEICQCRRVEVQP